MMLESVNAAILCIQTIFMMEKKKIEIKIFFGLTIMNYMQFKCKNELKYDKKKKKKNF